MTPTHHSTADLAYLAGILDGEGSISLVVEYGRSMGLLVAVGNTSRPLLDWLLETFGGMLYAERLRGMMRKPFWQWHIRGDAAVAVLSAVLPYLKIKAGQARLGCEAWEHRGAGRGRTALTAEVRERRLDYYLRMRALNGRAPQDEPRLPLVDSPHAPVALTCPECGVAFKRIPSKIKKSGRAFCGESCYRQWGGRHLQRLRAAKRGRNPE